MTGGREWAWYFCQAPYKSFPIKANQWCSHKQNAQLWAGIFIYSSTKVSWTSSRATGKKTQGQVTESAEAAQGPIMCRPSWLRLFCPESNRPWSGSPLVPLELWPHFKWGWIKSQRTNSQDWRFCRIECGRVECCVNFRFRRDWLKHALWCSPPSPILNCYSVGKLPIFRNFRGTWQALCDICCNHSSVSNITFEKIQSDTRDVKAFILSNCSPFLTHQRGNRARDAYRWGWWQHPWSNDDPGDFASFPAQLCNPHFRQFPTFSPAVMNPSSPRTQPLTQEK